MNTQNTKPMLEYVLDNLERTKGKWPKVSKAANVSYRTMQKIAMREIVDPGVSHIQKLHDYFLNEENIKNIRNQNKPPNKNRGVL